MDDEELKQAIIQYIKDYYRRNNEAPSLRRILKRFRREKLNLTRFYRIFPGGITEASRLADVPVPMERIKRTEKATESVRRRKQLNAVPSAQNIAIDFSHVFYVDEDGDEHTLEEFSENICGHLLDLDSNVRAIMEGLASTIKKIEDLESNFEEKVIDALNITCPKCGGKMSFLVVCPNCNPRARILAHLH